MRPIVAFLAASFVLAGCARVLGLPPVPESVDAAQAGLDGIAKVTEEALSLARPIDDSERARYASSPPFATVDRARWGKDRIAAGDAAEGLALLADLVVADPEDLVLGNEFRMEVFRLRRALLAAAKERGERMPELPDYVRHEPLATLERAAAVRPCREIRLQIALAYVDRMVLEPALEIKAPASIDSVRALSATLERDPHYVPALVGRGLNYLNRPHRLVWPEHPAPPADAASRDFGLATAVGLRVGGASPRLKGLLLLLLGDAYAHEGKPAVARSWWTLAGETTDDARVHAALRERSTWPEAAMPDRVEIVWDARMNDLDAPMGDLSFFWNDAARGPS